MKGPAKPTLVGHSWHCLELVFCIQFFTGPHQLVDTVWSQSNFTAVIIVNRHPCFQSLSSPINSVPHGLTVLYSPAPDLHQGVAHHCLCCCYLLPQTVLRSSPWGPSPRKHCQSVTAPDRWAALTVIQAGLESRASLHIYLKLASPLPEGLIPPQAVSLESSHWLDLFIPPSPPLIAQLVKNLPAKQETPVKFLDQEDRLEKG